MFINDQGNLQEGSRGKYCPYAQRPGVEGDDRVCGNWCAAFEHLPLFNAVRLHCCTRSIKLEEVQK